MRTLIPDCDNALTVPGWLLARRRQQLNQGLKPCAC